jgi:hypothetical protein
MMARSLKLEVIMKIIRAENGTLERVVDVEKIKIPDLWHIAECLNEQSQDMVIEVWHLAHDMRGALCAIANGADLKKPIHTK